MEKFSSCKPLLLTFDYEIFFGGVSGSVEKCLVEPVDKLIQLLKEINVRATFFVDTSYLLKLDQEKENFEALESDYKQVTNNIKNIILAGHDVQLHIHSHWLDAEYNCEIGSWCFSYERYRLHSLIEEDDEHNMNTVSGYVQQCSAILKKICKQVNPNYELYCFRAGGWSVQPFSVISKYLYNSGVRYDSSVLPGFVSTETDIHYFDFSRCPKQLIWKFDEKNVCEPVESGRFIQIPIPTVQISNWRLLLNFIKKKINGQWLKFGDGQGMKLCPPKFNRFKMVLMPLKNQLKYLDCDAYSFKLMRYMINKTNKTYAGYGPIVLLGHTKNISKASIDVIKLLADCKDYKFANSYKDFY